MQWTLMSYRGPRGLASTVLVGEVARTLVPIIEIKATKTSLRVVLRHVPESEREHMHPVVEKTKADPVRRMRGLARRVGASAPARRALGLVREEPS